MSWSSLFFFSNPNGEVGRQYSATSNVIGGSTSLLPNQNNKQILATFNYLPIGVYSVSTQVYINWKQGIDIEYCAIGLSQTASNPLNIFPETTLVASQSIDSSTAITAPLNANFIISVTNANPYYIYIDTTIGGSVSPTFTTNTGCIATKLA
jgi:hypothetical protein